MSYRLSDAADADLLAILIEGLDRFGLAQAKAYRAGLERVFELLARYPKMARLREEIAPAVRAHPHGMHMIIYDALEDGDIVIQRIRHAREDWVSDPL